MTTLFEHAALAAPGVVRHGFLGRRGGVSNGLYESLNCGYGSDDDAPAVRENRARAAAAFGRSADDLCTAHQVHGDVAIRVETAWPHGEAPRADGLVSNTPGVVLGILTADCAPVLLADGDNRVIGAFHAGWRGALGEVAALGRDTYAEEADFFSYRRNSQNGQRDYGRLLSAITLEA